MPKNNLPSVDEAKPPIEAKRHDGPQSADEIPRHMLHMTGLRNRADTRITREQAFSLLMKFRELQDSGARLKDGSPIATKSDAIRWMIEQPLAT